MDVKRSKHLIGQMGEIISLRFTAILSDVMGLELEGRKIDGNKWEKIGKWSD